MAMGVLFLFGVSGVTFQSTTKDHDFGYGTMWGPLWIAKLVYNSPNYLVGGLNPSEKIWKSIGMSIPNIWENPKWQPNHQPAMVYHDIQDYGSWGL